MSQTPPNKNIRRLQKVRSRMQQRIPTTEHFGSVLANVLTNAPKQEFSAFARTAKNDRPEPDRKSPSSIDNSKARDTICSSLSKHTPTQRTSFCWRTAFKLKCHKNLHVKRYTPHVKHQIVTGFYVHRAS